MRWIVVFAVVALTACRLTEAHYSGGDGGADGDMSNGDAGPSHELRVSTSSVPGTTSTGTILTSPEGTSCGTGCWRFAEGTPVTLSYAAAAGSFLHRWGNDCIGNATTCFVDMTIDHVASAQFTPANLAFVTSGTFWPSAADPVGSVDAACTSAAHAANRSGTYIGWLGSAMASWNTRLGSANGWVRNDGKVVATNKMRLDSPGSLHLFYPLTIDESGTPLSTTTHVISGLNGGDCNGWDAAAQGDMVSGLAGGSWLGAGLAGASDPCGTPAHLYCLQTDFDAALPPPPAENGRIAFVAGLFELPTGGVSGLDTTCATDAANFGLPGTYVALVATTTAPAASRLSTTGLPWVRMDGVPIVATAADLFASGGPQLIAPLDLDYRRLPLGGSAFTGAPDLRSLGTATSTCHDYTDGSGAAGRIHGDVTFPDLRMFDAGGGSAAFDQCNFQTSIYCFQE